MVKSVLYIPVMVLAGLLAVQPVTSAEPELFIGGDDHYHYKYPVISPDGQLIAFYSNRSGQSHIYYCANKQGTAEYRRISIRTDNYSSQPYFFAGGKRVLFFSTRGQHKGLYTVPLKRMWDAESRKRFSPDFWCESGKVTGTRVVYTGRRQQRFNIYIQDADGASPLTLIDDGSVNLTPHLAPSQRRLVYTSNRDGHFNLWIYNLKTKKRHQLTDDDKGSFMPVFSPDNQEIIFTGLRAGNNDIWLYRFADDSFLQLTRDGGRDISPSWHPDLKWIYFSSNRSGRFKIYRLPVYWRKAK